MWDFPENRHGSRTRLYESAENVQQRLVRISGKEEKKLPLISDEMYVSDIGGVFMFE